MNQNYILALINAEREIQGKFPVSVPATQDTFSDTTFNINQNLTDISESLGKSLGLHLQWDSSTNLLKAEQYAIGDMFIQDGKLKAQLDSPVHLISPIGIFQSQKKDPIDISWIAMYANENVPCFIKTKEESFLPEPILFRFNIQNSVYLTVSLETNPQDENAVRFFSYSHQGFLDALQYIFSISEGDKAVLSLCFFSPYDISHNVWISVSNDNRGFKISNDADLIPEYFEKLLQNQINGDHTIVYSPAITPIFLGPDIQEIENMVEYLQKTLSDHFDMIKEYAVSLPYHPEDHFQVLFKDMSFFRESLQLKYSRYKTATNEIPLRWGDIPQGAVRNAWKMLNQLVLSSKKEIYTICVKS